MPDASSDRPTTRGRARLRRDRRRRRAGRVDRRAGAGPGRPAGLPARAGPVPRLEEHVRRRRLRPHPRHAHPAVVGGGAGPALGHPPRHGDHDRDPVAHRRLPHHRVGRGALQRVPPPSGPTSTRGWPTRPSRPARCSVTSTTATAPAARPHAAGSSACRTDRPDGDLTARLRHRLRRGQLVPGQGGRPLPPRGARELHPRRQGGAGAAPRGDRQALRPHAATRAPTSRSSGAPRASPAAGSSTPTSTASPWASCSASPSWPRPRCGPRSSSPGSSATRWWRRGSRAPTSRSTRPTSSPRAATT